MNIKNKILIAATAALIPLNGFGYMAYAQAGSQEQIVVDEEFQSKVRAAIMANPEMILEAAQAAQVAQRQAAEARQAQAAQTIRTELSAKDTPGFVLGNVTGEQTFIEFLDYRCGFCRKAHVEVKSLIATNDEARIVVMMLPVLGEQSETLARFAIAAGRQGKFEEANSYLYENTVEPSDAGLRAAAEAFGANWTKIRSDMSSDEVTAKLENHKSYARRMDVRGTPFFITPTNVIPGAATRAELQAAAS